MACTWAEGLESASAIVFELLGGAGKERWTAAGNELRAYVKQARVPCLESDITKVCSIDA